MNGYENFENLLKYRIIPCEVVYGFKNGSNIVPIAYNPHDIGLDELIHEFLTKRSLKLSISEINHYYNNTKDYVVLPVPQGVNDIINSLSHVKVEVYQKITISKFKYILNQVKFKILSGCLELEKNNVLGFKADKESNQMLFLII